MAVRFSGGRALARKAERGATSMVWVQARRTRKSMANGRDDGMGIMARQIAEGRWVKTIVCDEN